MKSLDTGLQNGLAVYYLLVALMNLGFAAYYFYGPKKKGLAAVWAAVSERVGGRDQCRLVHRRASPDDGDDSAHVR